MGRDIPILDAARSFGLCYLDDYANEKTVGTVRQHAIK